jgi:hypothetical protein
MPNLRVEAGEQSPVCRPWSAGEGGRLGHVQLEAARSVAKYDWGDGGRRPLSALSFDERWLSVARVSVQLDGIGVPARHPVSVEKISGFRLGFKLPLWNARSPF